VKYQEDTEALIKVDGSPCLTAKLLQHSRISSKHQLSDLICSIKWEFKVAFQEATVKLHLATTTFGE
jgi:hypothetical protein